jgi:hypothetical protein
MNKYEVRHIYIFFLMLIVRLHDEGLGRVTSWREVRPN